MALPRILLIDDNKTRIQQLEAVFQFMGYSIEAVGSTEYAPYFNETDQLCGVFVGDGIDKQATVVSDIIGRADKIPVILVINKGTGLQLSTLIANSVSQVLEWPTTYPILKPILDKLPAVSGAATNFTVRETPDRRSSSVERLKGKSQAIAGIRKLIDQVAESDATVLILGESGTGKEVVARALHDGSLRKEKPFVPINCGAIPGELLESELFGHEKGAFTGALTSRQGRFEMAEGGTLFLDEIGDMPLAMQVKLLRVLQERTFERVGSNKTIHCDVRVIAATHRYLENEIKENRFREDLFYRLNVFPIEIPALKNRVEDIPLLVNDLIARMEASNRGSVRLTNAALTVLMQHEWPGNVRELANLIERLAIINPKGLVEAADLPEKFQKYKASEEIIDYTESVNLEEDDDQLGQIEVVGAFEGSSGALAQLPEQGIDLKEYLNVLEVDLIRQALNECSGVVAHAAKRLNMRRTTLVEKLRKYDLQR
ncbi:sigma-54 dependent transcriptional regulator [Methylobacter sp.]|uniref:sigma-54 dependent transcriptional regulator n=1 Tax=Methylobacter sp. TaxID=2051955 RepID=UPI0011F517E6|nr:sigma-54 dependent transcriptional regulator [Methylobacter sp.]TAK63699.1 MAG: sigma-54-dependent Fis family transcriptional regulator [Methylobacter sp.]